MDPQSLFSLNDVLAGFPDRQDIVASRLDPVRPHVPALGLGGKAARVAPLPVPPDRR